MIYVYPAVFSEVPEGGYDIEFPDLPGTHSQGDTLAEAMAMARDALATWVDCLLEQGLELPAPSSPNDVKHDENAFVAIIDADLDAYRRRWERRAVKKTLTVPSWLNEQAEKEGLNFSQVLQEALKERLGIAQ